MKTDNPTKSQGEFLLLPAHNNHEIFIHSWTNVDSPRIVLLIVHGMVEHGARYASLANFLNSQGVVVYAIDHRGHGRSAPTPEKIGHFSIDPQVNGWDNLITDLHTVVTHLKSAYPNLPLVILGHSMGSFVSLGYVTRHGKTLNGLILSASNSNSAFLCSIARVIARVEILRQGALGKSDLLYSLSFNSFNKKFKPARTDFDWLSRDPEQVDRYINDEKCGFKLGNKSWFDLLGGLIEITQPSTLARIPADLPVYIFGGDYDPVGGFGKGLQTLSQNIKAAGIRELEFKLYSQGRHEMINETNREEVYNDIIKWLKKTFAVK